MTIIILAISIGVSLLIFLIYSKNCNSAKVFDKKINLSVNLDFSQTQLKLDNKYGSLLFKIHNINEGCKSFFIEKIRFNTSKLSLRNFNSLHVSSPLKHEGVVLSVGVKRTEDSNLSDFANISVIISGFLVEENHQKVKFKKSIPAQLIQIQELVDY
ncbi:hypothetical protein [Sphingobacterium composti Ten et al. 2007 non Yoo et al. 2007]|uniref:hypothetical protein n=1 Tax=Sphingobacterium composti TaxID=363260 RepID=UPI00135BDBA9|nr:hypothetical protein [Sphingobacterium composti Ten et al. 2007 non Yoo et al. 2007]